MGTTYHTLRIKERPKAEIETFKPAGKKMWINPKSIFELRVGDRVKFTEEYAAKLSFFLRESKAEGIIENIYPPDKISINCNPTEITIQLSDTFDLSSLGQIWREEEKSEIDEYYISYSGFKTSDKNWNKGLNLI